MTPRSFPVTCRGQRPLLTALSLLMGAVGAGLAPAREPVKPPPPVRVGPPLERSRVPEPLRRGAFLSANPDRNPGPGVVWKYQGGPPKPLNLNCPFRMAASADGKVVAFGYPVHDFRGFDPKVAKRFDPAPPGMITVRNTVNAEHV